MGGGTKEGKYGSEGNRISVPQQFILLKKLERARQKKVERKREKGRGQEFNLFVQPLKREQGVGKERIMDVEVA